MLAFRDIHPQAPVHLLIIPREHIPSLEAVTAGHADLLGHILITARNLARESGLENGFRVVNNCGPAGGQTVYHLHFHLLGGRGMQWPPG